MDGRPHSVGRIFHALIFHGLIFERLAPGMHVETEEKGFTGGTINQRIREVASTGMRSGFARQIKASITKKGNTLHGDAETELFGDVRFSKNGLFFIPCSIRNGHTNHNYQRRSTAFSMRSNASVRVSLVQAKFRRSQPGASK